MANAMKGVVNLKVVSPMLQIVKADQSVTSTRKGYFVFDVNGIIETKVVPFISGESLRGLARRRVALAVMKRIMEKDDKSSFNAKTIHMLVDGGMTTLSGKLSYNEESEWRERVPFFSVFGVGLTFGGKLIIQDAFPVAPDTDQYAHLMKYGSIDDLKKTLSGFMGRFPFSKKDDILNHEAYIFDFLTAEDISAWEKEAKEKSESRKKHAENKKNNKGKEKEEDLLEPVKNESKGTTQTWQETEFIAPGTLLRTEISTFEDEPLSDAEKGCILLACTEMAKVRRIGANQRKNWGLFDSKASISDEDGSNLLTIAREIDKTNLLNDADIIERVESKGKRYIESFWEKIDALTAKDIDDFREQLEKKKDG